MAKSNIKNDIRLEQYKNMLNVINRHNHIQEEVSNTLKATRMRSIINSYRLVEAYKADSKVAYVGEQFPTEIVYAFNMQAWNIESMAILFAQSVNIEDFFQLSEENFLSRDICSFLRAPFATMHANCYPRPNIVLSNDQPCDCLAKLGYIASQLYNSPYFSLNTPNEINGESINYLVAQINKMILKIEKELSCSFDENNFKKIVEYSNEAKEYYCKTTEILKKSYVPRVSRELLEIFGLNAFGLKETVSLCKVLYEEALEISQKQNTKKKRVLWMGQAPEGFHEIIKYLERELDIIFSAILWDGTLMSLDIENPIHSIAKRAILFHWHSDRMKENTAMVCDEFGIEAIIIANVWGCRNMLGIRSVIKEVAEEKNLKYLTINLDVMDRNNYAFNQVKNRLDAFLEII
ncbi:2-hydroxyacyl-CoA dehydratase family protein [Paramaledivibacter caminithermalis]|jgi:benzoyl-CoA reductase/2-hydroxyglutaryl-CoA dehydratase subunit BcrC/BadD/HgdB|nr:2-hydroxyacyl-CoA dehydratase family protein [Paramaledivibacter caminithermalis]